jgi:hypothetical protein
VGELFPFVLTWASGETLGRLCTPGLLAFIEIPVEEKCQVKFLKNSNLQNSRFAILGDLICDKSMPPGVYVNGFLSFVIIAFCTQAGASDICVCNRFVGMFPAKGGGGGALKIQETEPSISACAT